MNKIPWLLLGLLLLTGAVFAQRRSRDGGDWGSRSGGRFGGRFGESRLEELENPRQDRQHSYETPMWTNTPGFEKDVFTFVRIKRGHSTDGNGGPWSTDTPDSDLNLSWRLSQMTAMKVNPDGRFLHLTDRGLADYPFIYMVEPGSLGLQDEEVVTLRKYLLNGGFLWLDDFWGEYEWAIMARELKKVFPDRDWVELPISHPLYHCVFDIKSKAQVPAEPIGTASQYTGVTWEDRHEGDVRTVHHKAIFDDKGRLMVFATHNTDNGDGWEWEGDNHYYFENFSEKIAYPLAINVIFYTMTH